MKKTPGRSREAHGRAQALQAEESNLNAEGHIAYEERGAVGYVTLDRPAKRNALTGEMLDALAGVFARVRGRTDLRAVILAGAGADFCAGTDIAELAGLGTEGARHKASRGQEVCDAIELCGTPVIAAVRGAAAGGGCELALACHLRVASTDARFTLPETRLGLIPAYGGTQRLPRAAGHSRALAAMLAGEGVRAEEALRLGLVNRVVGPGEVTAEADALARSIVETSAPLAARACLEAVTRGARLTLEEGLKLEAELFAGLFSTEDVREGTRAFLEKREPSFRGR